LSLTAKVVHRGKSAIKSRTTPSQLKLPGQAQQGTESVANATITPSPTPKKAEDRRPIPLSSEAEEQQSPQKRKSVIRARNSQSELKFKKKSARGSAQAETILPSPPLKDAEDRRSITLSEAEDRQSPTVVQEAQTLIPSRVSRSELKVPDQAGRGSTGEETITQNSPPSKAEDRRSIPLAEVGGQQSPQKGNSVIQARITQIDLKNQEKSIRGSAPEETILPSPPQQTGDRRSIPLSEAKDHQSPIVVEEAETAIQSRVTQNELKLPGQAASGSAGKETILPSLPPEKTEGWVNTPDFFSNMHSFCNMPPSSKPSQKNLKCAESKTQLGEGANARTVDEIRERQEKCKTQLQSQPKDSTVERSYPRKSLIQMTCASSRRSVVTSSAAEAYQKEASVPKEPEKSIPTMAPKKSLVVQRTPPQPQPPPESTDDSISQQLKLNQEKLLQQPAYGAGNDSRTTNSPNLASQQLKRSQEKLPQQPGHGTGNDSSNGPNFLARICMVDPQSVGAGATPGTF